MQKQADITDLKAPLSNLQTTAVSITLNVEQPPGEKRIEGEKRDSKRKSYAQVLMNTSTAKDQIPDTDSRFSLLAIDDRNVTDNRSQKKRKKLAKSSIAETSIGKNASVDFQEIYRDLLDGEKREGVKDLNIPPPEICTNFSQIRNDSAFNASSEDILTSQDNGYSFLLEEIQKSSTCQKPEENARLPHVCLSQANVPNL